MEEPQSKLPRIENDIVKSIEGMDGIEYIKSEHEECLECVTKDAQLQKLRVSEGILKRDFSQMVLLKQQYLRLAQQIILIKSERDEALNKAKNIEISMVNVNTGVNSLLSITENLITCLKEMNEDLHSIVSTVFALNDRFETYVTRNSVSTNS